MYEDTILKAKSFEELLALRMEHEANFILSLKIREDETSIDSDLLLNIGLILIDDDLGNNSWGDAIIERIMIEVDTNPDYQSVPIIYYSAGTDVKELKNKSSRWGHIRCTTYEDLIDEIIVFFEEKKATK